MRYSFGCYELDTRLCELRRDAEPCRVEPQVFDVLAYLLQHRDRVVAKNELIEKVWGHTFIASSTLSSRLMAARRAVGDSGRSQRIIKTLHGRGYRFIAAVHADEAQILHETEISSIPIAHAPAGQLPAAGIPGGAALQLGAAGLVSECLPGRESEMGRLDALLDEALAGAMRLVFLTGEPGIGRSALAEAFLERVRRRGGIGIACGQCVDQHAFGEPYLPILEAIGRICREPAHQELIPLLHRLAPTWLAQMAALLPPGEMRQLEERIRGITRPGMLREMAEALEDWTADRPLVLVVEDLHWSDPSTLHLLDYLARRKKAARLLVIATCHSYPRGAAGPDLRALIDELSVHGLCSELVLRRLTVDAVRTQIERLFAGRKLSDSLPHLVHERTGGNPLFVQVLLDDWTGTGVLSHSAEELQLSAGGGSAAIPQTLHRLVERQIGCLAPADEAMLEAASVAGLRFSAPALVAALGLGLEEVEERCERIVRRGGILEIAEPAAADGGASACRYAFAHPLIREVFYASIPPGLRARLDRQIDAFFEAGDAPMAPEANEIVAPSERGAVPLGVIHRFFPADGGAAGGGGPDAPEHREKTPDVTQGHHDMPDPEVLLPDSI